MNDETDGGENMQAASSELQIQARSEPMTHGKDEPSVYAKPSPVPVTLEMGSLSQFQSVALLQYFRFACKQAGFHFR